jgi:hypothetical protein
MRGILIIRGGWAEDAGRAAEVAGVAGSGSVVAEASAAGGEVSGAVEVEEREEREMRACIIKRNKGDSAVESEGVG